MTQTIEAIYQNGMFRPLTPVSQEFREGLRVTITVNNASAPEEANPILAAADNFYEGLTEEDIREIEKIALDRSNFFGDRER